MSDHPLTAADVAALRERGSTSTAAEVVARLCDDWGRLAAENVRLKDALKSLLANYVQIGRNTGHPLDEIYDIGSVRKARAALADAGPAPVHGKGWCPTCRMNCLTFHGRTSCCDAVAEAYKPADSGPAGGE